MRKTAHRRFFEKVEKSAGGCWLWTATKNNKGYGQFSSRGRMMLAHRWAYELFVGAVPDGLELDHLCRERACVRPEHLEPVTRSENMRRGEQGGPREVCRNGHPYTPENTGAFRPRSGVSYQRCKTCRKLTQRRYRARRRAALSPIPGNVLLEGG